MEQLHIKMTKSLGLKNGLKQMSFNESGGYIGSGNDCQWVVNDIYNNFREKHVHIKSNGDIYCLMAYKGSPVYMNGDHSPVISNYYIMLSTGDSFQIGELEFTVVSAEDMEDLSDETSETSIEDIEDYKKLDDYVVIPEGQQEGIKAEDEISIEKLIDDKVDVLGIEESYEESNFSSKDNDFVENSVVTKQVMKDFLKSECNNILENEIKKSVSIIDIINGKNGRLSTKDLSYIISNFNLVNNTKVINLLVISLLFKELDSPFFEELESGGWEKIMSTIIKNASSDKNSIERMVVQAVKKYIGE